MADEFDIAIVGMSCRLPGAQNVDEFWRNLADGVESIAPLTDQEILASGVPAEFVKNASYVKAAPVLEEPGHFDARFFGFSAMEARNMDPQQRILLELAYEALEEAGYDSDRFHGRIGVFTGSALNTYFTNVGLDRRLAEEYIPTLIGNDKDFLSTRISYKLNLKGPSITIQTACSTSMVAVHLARQSLLSGETDMALAGAISVRVPHRAGYFYDGGGVVSPDGHVRAFDANANGTVFGSGGGILVLKRLTDALLDGDNVHAVIKGSAVNNDGAEKAGYTAPSVNSQADAVVEALANAGIDADSISYVEAHGSGTPVGDPIEISALTKAFRTFTQRSGYCAIGSAKTNVGHLDAAAAVTGMIKTILALKQRKLPPSLHFNEANREINFPETPFYVNTRLREWTSDGPRRAGVMSTGMGGTNAHVVIEEAPELSPSTEARPPHLIVLSAKTETALSQATHNLRHFLSAHDDVNMSDVAYTLQVGRKAFAHRRYVICASREDTITVLAEETSKRVFSNRADESRRPVVLLLPGIGDHYVGMAHGLYDSWPTFKEEVDRCAHILQRYLGIDIRTIIYPSSQTWKTQGNAKGIDLKKMLGRQTDAANDQEAANLNKTLFAQPALFTIEYAMSRLWQSLGVMPDAIAGHSMGEYVAACLAGVLSLDDALRLIATRAKLVNDLPHGSMLAVMLPETELRASLPEDISISLINGPDLCVVAGPVPSVAEFEKTLNARDVICRHVQNAHAFHSRMLDPIVDAFEAEVGAVQLNKPTIPYLSNVTGTWITGEQATDPKYWAMHAHQTARFGDAMRAMWQLDNPILVEAGPGRTVGVLAMQHPDRRGAETPIAISSIRHSYEHHSDVEHLWQAIGRLWLSGIPINWESAHRVARRRRVTLPTYPFERQRYWLEATTARIDDVQQPLAASERSGIDHWFYVPTWQRAPFVRETSDESKFGDAFWLIVADRYGGGRHIKSKLDSMRLRTGWVQFGQSFVNHGDDRFEVNPAGVDDFLKMFRKLQGQMASAINIVHLGSLTRRDDELTTTECVEAQKFGFYSLLHMAQAIGELNISAPIRIGIVSNRIHEVTGDEHLNPAMATVLGLCGVIPKELPNILCFNIDLPDTQPVERIADDVLTAILAEYRDPAQNSIVAYRGRHRWERAYRPTKLKTQAPASAHDAVSELKRLRSRGVYLITGGTGGIGLTIAKYLAETCKARIVLTKRTPFPEKSTWKELSAAPGTPERVLRTISALLEIERFGAEVDVEVAESSDREQMQRVIEKTYRTFGPINGVIHAAGIVRAGLMQAKTDAAADSVLAPKVYGTMVLYDLLKDTALDFFVLFSSITSAITPYAESDYSAANSFLDAFAHFANGKRKFHALAINWPGWKEVGQLVDLEIKPGLESWKQAALGKAIRTADGLEAFKRALHSDLTQVIVSPEDLEQLVKESRLPFDHAKYIHEPRDDAPAVAYRSSPKASEQPPANDVEALLTDIWNRVLGVEQIGSHDNFSQLGGHSLLAMQVVAKIRSTYQINFTLREFFEAPTIAKLTAAILAKIGLPGECATDDQALSLLSPMGQRSFSATRVQKALFLGLSDRRIFAIYHPALQNATDVLTVICPPLFNEYMRTQLALRELAISLAERGQHVLRFDYRGTGDSLGELGEVTVSDWLEDIAIAVREGRDLSGCNAVRLLGVRAGGLLACRSAKGNPDIDRWVLWDPINDGAGYLKTLRRIQRAIIERGIPLREPELRDSLHEYAGYRLSERMVEEFRSLDATAYSDVPNNRLYIVSTSSERAAPVEGASQDVAHFACNWDTDLENLMMPKPVLERLSVCLTMS